MTRASREVRVFDLKRHFLPRMLGLSGRWTAQQERQARLLREVTSKESEVWVSRTQQSASSGAKPAP